MTHSRGDILLGRFGALSSVNVNRHMPHLASSIGEIQVNIINLSVLDRQGHMLESSRISRKKRWIALNSSALGRMCMG